ncbi:hypothetical protein H6F78_06410 [Coleofasciculus sp. FACHB-64]|uniref:hypothetical protein n=1 Tax=Cyanophyceae TaxID=3028117 RepID=UPI0016896CA5|nr:hypothetical protein [Coleofasciculus sp. FACHB-501]MBD1879233.1 hypothetical protein [Coleofasciculus sp. FACHB-T130]MBD1892023.1 hypothetical protein [Coleofasciculus sp. FACHB-SPT9]MBD1895962.1 hypothetical protein [Coleofasciculus sp. FACHB-129]MBD1902214.1 hypothetical protein [Coleofasciculus sp. FACHB-125]MBD1943675.1 hypothetical protein [Coleofasciculus sp. FACHB-712]MBD2045231.1 hypothetical protein [Coleofasciculus sp. FACHB-64]MBD2083865.1 hypothetical protein [Coleofasciculus
MPSQKDQKIDLNNDYPCPCRRRGRLVPITLTEAFGCDRCQQIFVVEESGYAIEQLSTSYPYKRSWRWTGHRWSTAHPGLGDSYLPVSLGIIAVVLIAGLCLAQISPPAPPGIIIVLCAMVSVLALLVPALIIWLTHRR